METKKDIGAAIKHRLTAFKDSPDSIVWNTIEGELKKKKKRGALFLWFTGFGFATLILGFWLISPNKSSVEKDNIDREINTVDANKTATNKTKAAPNIIRFDSHPSIQTDPGTHVIESSENRLIHKNAVSDSNRTMISERSNKETDKQQLPNSNYNQNYSLKNEPNSTINTALDVSNSSSDKTTSLKVQKADTTDLIIKSKQVNTRDLTMAKRESLAINKRIRDSIKKTRQSQNRFSEEKTEKTTTDSITEDEQSKWSITPHTTLSYYGAFNNKTTDNFTLNYGVLASYRMTPNTYIRIGVRQLNLQQTIENETHKLEYLEFPLEIKHSPFHKKINPYFTGGFSYFFLQNTNINNLNTTDYSATLSINIGLGVATKIFKKMYFNLEPKFNYQLKPFTNENAVKPYILSIQTGIEYRF
jgi:hypothetical protein